MSLLRLLSLLVLLILVLLGLDPIHSSSAADLAARRAAAQARLLALQAGDCHVAPALPGGLAANGAQPPACAGFAVKTVPMDSYQGTKARAPKQNTVRGRGLPKMPTTRSTG
ncbi:hypothetical protein KRX52_07625 [Pseudomonas sp. MAP12]|uniref:Uncharacterized protein n=1 Tax=Geopseudomonas aromaticivorans TaxID=2849492 RepID=A0ABS6MV35_9GAMM|nr:hypothetical protein [Pseudomonas aromaticivorans]MBV2132673.1 hypothetical protein [Pseudomonas aromaticivorans]